MLNYKNIGKQISSLRKAKGLTGEKLAESIGVSPQAVSKWETGKCIPESSILPLLSRKLDCSIDNILIPRELQILNATYGDGVTNFDVKRLLDNFIVDNKLNVIINKELFGINVDSDRLMMITVQYKTELGVFFAYTCDNSMLSLNAKEEGYRGQVPIKIIAAFYGDCDSYKSVIDKINHYDYFKQTEILVNHETFPSSVSSEKVEYLTLVYINDEGIYTVCCKEGEWLCYNRERNYLYAYDKSQESCILPDVIKLNWGNKMDCTWAGAMFAALKYMGHDISYDYIMGVSAACFRIAFSPVWDFSSVDALVVYDYAEIAYKALGYEVIWADRIEKSKRIEERNNIIRDIKLGRPLIAINLRIAPEWGVITGYVESGKQLLCRTYFDEAVFDDKRYDSEFQEVMKQTGGYLNVDCWPFAIAHFGEKKDRPSEKENLINSLRAKVESMAIPERRGYLMGYEAYKGWVEGLLNDDLFTGKDKEIIERRLQVNDYQLLNLFDARKSASIYLRNLVKLYNGEESQLLEQLAKLYETMSNMLKEFYDKLQMQKKGSIGYMDKCLIQSKGCYSKALREEQAHMLENILSMEYLADDITKNILKVISTNQVM